MTDRPIRIQLSRKKGWRMPPNTVKVDRSTKWGNPWSLGAGRSQLVSWFRRDIEQELLSPTPIDAYYPPSCRLHWIAHNVQMLRGKNLACWCPLDQPCHADVLLELANRDIDQVQP